VHPKHEVNSQLPSLMSASGLKLQAPGIAQPSVTQGIPLSSKNSHSPNSVKLHARGSTHVVWACDVMAKMANTTVEIQFFIVMELLG